MQVQTKGKNSDWVEVKADFLSGKNHTLTFSASDFDSIVILVGSGNGHVKVDRKITKAVLIDGGAGYDRLIDRTVKYKACDTNKNGAFHKMQVSPFGQWVKDFVIGPVGSKDTPNPNSGIQVGLPPANIKSKGRF